MSGRVKLTGVLVLAAVLAMLLAGLTPALAQSAESGVAASEKKALSDEAKGMFALSIALVVGASCIGAGIAVGRVGSAALGAASERPELLGKSLILVGLAEGIAIYGLIVGVMLLRLL
ncbi:MAG TPA: ATP synthase subunit C [Vicinamibacterales bacterium]|nr:ATP synthase subunit C [Vicinamibacterales bacterium]